MVYKLIQKEILKYLKRKKEAVSCLKISYDIDVSYPTILKHINILNKQGKVFVKIGGEKKTAKMVSLNETKKQNNIG